jgi:hypothetical protein
MATLDNARKLKLDNNDNNQSTCNHHLTETVKNNGLLNDNCQPQNNQFVKSQQLSSYWKNDNQTATTKPTNKNYENSEEKNQKFKTEKTTFSEYEESRTLSTTNTTYRHLAKASSNDEPTDSPNWSKAWPSSKINGLKRESVAADGNCLFHALAMHTTFNSQELRNVIANYLEKNINRFANWLVTAPQDYIKKIRHDQTWGGEIEITAAMELLQRPIYVIQHESKLIPYVPNNTSKDDQPIFLHYTGSHYDGYHIQQGYSAQNIVAQLNEQFGQDIPRSLKNDCLHYMSLFASEKETEQTINAITSSSCNSLTQQ